jgi:hypothetical protein
VCNPVLRRLRQKDEEFKASLGYIVNYQKKTFLILKIADNIMSIYVSLPRLKRC